MKTSHASPVSPDNRPIGVFDSGLGGLTVVSALMKKLPAEDILYLGDTARVPYGDKSVDSIIRFAHQDLEFLEKRGAKMFVVACNTVSAVAMEPLRRNHPDAHIVGVLEAGIRAAIRSGARRITVIGTRATVNSDAYRRGIHAIDHSIVVESIACPLFVPLAEEGMISGPVADAIVASYLGELRNDPPEAILLGCTHYPLFIDALRRFLGDEILIIDSATACADFVIDYLQEHHLGATPGKKARYGCFVTDLPSEFTHQATRFLGRTPGRVDKISLGE